jgi:drug/metabolite transporter (DMT)-like permease
MLLALSAIWGASFAFIKVGVRDLDPITLVAARVSLGALSLAPVVLITLGGDGLRELGGAVRPLVVVGLVNSTLPFWFLSWAETRIDSGLAAVIQASAPLFTAVLALRFRRSERVTGLRLFGLVVGFCGVVLLVGAQPRGDLVAGLAVAGSAFCYAVAALYAARRLADVSPLVTSLGALTVASLATLPLGLANLPAAPPGWKVIASVLVLGVGGTGFAYILYYGLLAGAGASRSILVTYLVPALALLYGALLLGEPITAVAVGGLALVLGGVALGTGVLRPARLARARARISADTLRP